MHKLLGMLVLGLTLTIGFGSVGGCKKGDKAQTEEEKKAEAAKKKKADDEAAAKKKADDAAAAAAKAKGGKGDAAAEKKELALTAPKDFEVKPGAKHEVSVKIERTKFDEPVDVSFTFPEDSKVTAKGGTIPKGETTGMFTVMVDKKAAEGSVEGTVTAKGGGKEATGKFKVNVKK